MDCLEDLIGFKLLMLAVICPGLSPAEPPQVHGVGNIAHPVEGGDDQGNQDQYILFNTARVGGVCGSQLKAMENMVHIL